MVDFGFRPNATTMALDDLLNNGQTHAAAFVFVAAVKPFEGHEQSVDALHVKADAVVGDAIDGATLRSDGVNGDHRLLAGAAELDGIAQEIHEDLTQENDVGVAVWKGADAEFSTVIRGFAAKGVDDSGDKGGGVDLRFAHCFFARARIRKQVIGQLAEPIGSGQNVPQVAQGVRAEFAGVSLDDKFAEESDAAKRTPEFVSEHRGQSAQLLILPLEAGHFVAHSRQFAASRE